MGTSLLTPMEVDSIPPPQSLPSPSRKAERYSPPFRGEHTSLINFVYANLVVKVGLPFLNPNRQFYQQPH